ncbi:pH-response regulator protein palF/RIM8 [Golovinomyces cichoracearum]|uniref:pH-response regulator protein palF/RIM8 n=1 Tax=Golovinomyces cichoracearum TaxID=62708 RepID=A0A420IDW7_9PEZI|nr:pH-response regulator protein palF/RIM8 [Golovinomyces cichoracearum]
MFSTPWSTKSRNILNRLSLLTPLRTRSFNLTEFHIRPDEPHRQYSPGDTVKGTVVITSLKPIRITHLTVCLHGFVRVFKSPNCSNEPFVDPGLTTSHDVRKSQYFGNRHASIFKDEVTLCGEGHLDAGIYEFKFELILPSKGLPTSIDFERGTISYLITATITRPTSINATSSCDRKISLVEKVDIGPMLPPKPRVITLTSIKRKTLRKRSGRKRKEDEPLGELKIKSESASATSCNRPDDSESLYGSPDRQIEYQIRHENLDFNENQSVASGKNSFTSTEGSCTDGSLKISASGSTKSQVNHCIKKQILKNQSITAKIELQRSGCLPGDTLPIKISIKHRKAIRSMHGVIITLFRQGKIETTPSQSFFPLQNDKEAAKLKHEEYYPKSMTGLGGLSLTSAGSSSIYRKDLAQTFAPIVVDPKTFSAVINASIRVPEHVFPTIRGVPGQMIIFTYHVEVVLDLGGRLAGQQRYVPLFRSVILPSSSNYVNTTGRPDHNSNILGAWGGNIIGTEAIRREKNVVACSFEITVGSEDSARNSRRKEENKAQLPEDFPAEEARNVLPILQTGSRNEDVPLNSGLEDADHKQSNGDYSSSFHDFASQYFDSYTCDSENNAGSCQDSCLPPTHYSISAPPPEIFADSALSDKERSKRAEERLLPSCPPIDIMDTSSSIHLPTLPSCVTENDFHNTEIITPTAIPINLKSMGNPSTPTFNRNDSTTLSNQNDDKQELERQRLMAEASAPLAESTDHASENIFRSMQPTAPVLNEENEYASYCPYSNISAPLTIETSESLPRYEK